MAREIRGSASSGTLYARLMNPSGYWWNGSTFEAYTAANYDDYVLAMTEQGASGVYVADFPSTVTVSGTYQYFVHSTGGSPAEGDDVVNTGEIDWSGSGLVSSGSITGSLSGSEWRDYVLRLGFKRTDKDTELYEATTDAIQEMRRRFNFDEAAQELLTTDAITVLGDFKIDLESDFGILIGVAVEDGANATPLIPMTKAQFAFTYPDINVTADRGYPKHFCVYKGQIQIGPIPSTTDYYYRMTYAARAATILSTTVGVPFTANYRDILADNVMARLYKGLEEYEKAGVHRNDFELAFQTAKRKELINTSGHFFIGHYRDV